MDPSQYLKNYPQPLHLHPNSSFRLNNNSRDSNSFQSNSPRSRDRPYFNRSGGGPYRHRKQNSESQYSSDGSNFNDSSSSSSMNSPYHRRFNNQVSKMLSGNKYFRSWLLQKNLLWLPTQTQQVSCASQLVQYYYPCIWNLRGAF